MEFNKRASIRNPVEWFLKCRSSILTCLKYDWETKDDSAVEIKLATIFGEYFNHFESLLSLRWVLRFSQISPKYIHEYPTCPLTRRNHMLLAKVYPPIYAGDKSLKATNSSSLEISHQASQEKSSVKVLWGSTWASCAPPSGDGILFAFCWSSVHMTPQKAEALEIARGNR